MRPRAYSNIGPGVVRLGNAWFERGWSTFTGGTVELTQKRAAPVHWGGGDSPEFRISCRERVFGVMELGDTEWSEEITPHAAGLFLRKSGPEHIEVHIQTHALHHHPGQLRRLSIYNAGESPCAIDSVLIEALPIARPPESIPAAITAGLGQGVVWQEGGCGLLLGVFGAATLEACAWNAAAYGVVVPGPGMLPPGKGWKGPETCLIPFIGPPDEALPETLAAFLEQITSMTDWERKRAVVSEQESIS